LVTVEEKALIEAHITPEKRATLVWKPYTDGVRVTLQGPPCPLLEGNTCSVYPVRPYQCRRWGCFRPDPSAEPLIADHGFLGAQNTRERYEQSRTVRRELQLMQRRAMRWALKHGWTGNEA
jgi:Fe-S-cluster containining protein